MWTLIYRGEGHQIFVDDDKRVTLHHSTMIVGFNKVNEVVEWFEFQNHNSPN